MALNQRCRQFKTFSYRRTGLDPSYCKDRKPKYRAWTRAYAAPTDAQACSISWMAAPILASSSSLEMFLDARISSSLTSAADRLPLGGVSFWEVTGTVFTV